jgi:CelD/BcsL family acetyltransferase involved in cellulose biosynthesis
MGFDPDFSELSPGRLMLLSVAEDCITRGVAGMDFLRGSENYKYDWSPKETKNYTMLITNG